MHGEILKLQLTYSTSAIPWRSYP